MTSGSLSRNARQANGTGAPALPGPPRTLGLYDFSGNAQEWCEDRWDAAGAAGVLRGSSFDNGSQGFLLSCNRSKREQGNRSASDGFRVVLAAAPSPDGKAPASAPGASWEMKRTERFI